MTLGSLHSERADTPAQELTAIAESVRGTFQTMEAMVESFVRQAILQGVYKPGERLNQDAIADLLGVSRMPVRASLHQLEAEGLVRIKSHRGATVSVLQRHEIAEIYELRVLIEGHLLKLAIARLSDEDLADLEVFAREVDDQSTMPGRVERRKDFYERLYTLADRPLALAMGRQLRDSVGRYLLMIRADELDPHAGLLVHLQARDQVAAKKWLTDHLLSVSRKIQAAVPDGQDIPEK